MARRLWPPPPSAIVVFFVAWLVSQGLLGARLLTPEEVSEPVAASAVPAAGGAASAAASTVRGAGGLIAGAAGAVGSGMRSAAAAVGGGVHNAVGSVGRGVEGVARAAAGFAGGALSAAGDAAARAAGAVGSGISSAAGAVVAAAGSAVRGVGSAAEGFASAVKQAKLSRGIEMADTDAAAPQERRGASAVSREPAAREPAAEAAEPAAATPVAGRSEARHERADGGQAADAVSSSGALERLPLVTPVLTPTVHAKTSPAAQSTTAPVSETAPAPQQQVAAARPLKPATASAAAASAGPMGKKALPQPLRPVIMMPVAGQRVGRSMMVSGRAHPGGSVFITVTDTAGGREWLNSVTSDNGYFTVAFYLGGLKDGSLNVLAAAEDADGNWGSAQPVRVHKQEAPPWMLLVTQPEQGAVVGQQLEIVGTAWPGATVEVAASGPGGSAVESVVQAAASGDFAVVLDIASFGKGTVTVHARAADADGVWSDPLRFSVTKGR